MATHTPRQAPADKVQARLSDIEKLLPVDPVAAENRAAELLQQVPDHPMALLFKGIARRLSGNFAGAIDVLSPLSVSSADAPIVHLQLGQALRESGKYEAAITSLRRAVGVKPDYSDAWLALADLLTVMEEKEAANGAFISYARFAMSEPRLKEAATALAENRLADAEPLLRRLLEYHPLDIVSLCMLAEVMERQGNRQEAGTLLAQCLHVAPGYNRARHNYAVLLFRQNRTTEALQQTDELLANEPKNPDFRRLRAAILVRLREYDESIALCEELLAENPDQPSVWTSLGHMLRAVGKRDDCIHAYRQAIRYAPHFGEAYWNLANLKVLSVTDDDLHAMQAQLDSSGLSDSDRLHFHFAVGKALEDKQEFARAFTNYDAGNRLRRKEKPYDYRELSDYVRRARKFFSGEFFAGRTDYGCDADDPIFIIGLPRSGSTLVEQILASHSSVEGTMELTDMAVIAKSLDRWEPESADGQYPETLAALTPETSRTLGEQYLESTRIQRKERTPRFIDKMPNNFTHVGLVHLLLPRARIIDVRRHPLACGLSLYKELFAGAQIFSYDLADIGYFYLDYVKLMSHYDAVLPGRVHRVYYESLIEDTEKEINRLLDYCKLPFEQSCLEFHRTERSVSTASSEQVRSPIYTSGLDHWRNFEAWLQPLQEVVAPLLEEYPEVPEHIVAGSQQEPD